MIDKILISSLFVQQCFFMLSKNLQSRRFNTAGARILNSSKLPSDFFRGPRSSFEEDYDQGRYKIGEPRMGKSQEKYRIDDKWKGRSSLNKKYNRDSGLQFEGIKINEIREMRELREMREMREIRVSDMKVNEELKLAQSYENVSLMKNPKLPPMSFALNTMNKQNMFTPALPKQRLKKLSRLVQSSQSSSSAFTSTATFAFCLQPQPQPQPQPVPQSTNQQNRKYDNPRNYLMN